ncbi:MAG: IS4 family transposase, partial [Chloroflexales bacterium]|nr:IS4 family transposase [Chloroflexales bacterium]
MSTATADLPRLSRELDGIELGDARLEARARKVAADVAREPGKSFPQIYEDDAGALEGLYRLCNNPKVTPEKIHRAHAAATAARCAGEKLVLAAHDTTVFGFGKETERTGLGPVDGGEDGFYGHLTLMVSGDDGHRPLGIAALMAWTREVIPAELRGTEHRTERAKSREQNARESVRWKAQVEKTEQALHGSTAIIHLGDREADDYDFFADLLVRQTARFIIRAKHDRLLANADADEEKGGVAGKLRSTLQRAAVMGTYTLAVKDRKPGADVAPKARKDHPPRKARLASLEVRATTVNLARPTKASKDLPAALTLNAVWVHEPDCPADEEPIDWLLLTTEGIATESEVLQVIKHYQGRWRIEEFFKALKTGCAFERR